MDTVLENWIYAGDQLNAAIESLVPLSTNNSSDYMELQFLAAAQTLEAIACADCDVKALPDGDFEHYLDVIENSVQEAQIKTWALDRLRNRNRKGQRRLIGDLIKSVGPFANKVFPDSKAFVKRHVQMRNDVTHRSPDSSSIEHTTLFYHTHGVIILCHAALMRKIGLSSKDVCELMKKSCFRAYLIGKAASLYPSKKTGDDANNAQE